MARRTDVIPLPGESMKQAKKRFKAEDRLQKDDRRRADRLSKAHPELGIDVESYVRQESAKRQPRPQQMPPRLEEPPERQPRAWEAGGMVEGTYQRRSTIEVERIEAHLDSLAEREAQSSVAKKYKQMFGEDLPIPEGYELIPERRVKRRAGGPTAEEAPEEAAPSTDAALETYGATPPPAGLTPLPAPPAPEAAAPPPAVEAPAPVPGSAPPAEVAPPAEAAATTEVVVEAPPAPAPTAAPEAAPAPVVAGPASPQVAGVAGAPAAAAATAATATAATKPKEEEAPLKLRHFLDLRRFSKIGPRAAKRGGAVTKMILGVINLILYIALLLIFLAPVWFTIYVMFMENKAKRAEEEKRAREWDERYGLAEPGAEGYYDEGGYYDYAPEGYEGEPAPEAGYDYGEGQPQPYAARDNRGDRAGRGGYREEYPDEEGYGY
jgi:hypothetical protein